MVVSRISVLILSLKDECPNRSVFVKLSKVNLDTWESIFGDLSEGTSFI